MNQQDAIGQDTSGGLSSGTGPATGSTSSPFPTTSTYDFESILTLRRLLRLNQSEFGDLLGFSHVHVGRFESGKSPITPELIGKIRPLLPLALETIEKDLRAYNALKELYDPPE